jgi:hypothetical protein
VWYRPHVALKVEKSAVDCVRDYQRYQKPIVAFEIHHPFYLPEAVGGLLFVRQTHTPAQDSGLVIVYARAHTPSVNGALLT